MQHWEEKVLAEPGAEQRVEEIRKELKHVAKKKTNKKTDAKLAHWVKTYPNGDQLYWLDPPFQMEQVNDDGSWTKHETPYVLVTDDFNQKVYIEGQPVWLEQAGIDIEKSGYTLHEPSLIAGWLEAEEAHKTLQHDRVASEQAKGE